jgi:hypothetical protein
MTCPATGIKDFPIQSNVTVTQTLNDSIKENSTLEIQWAKRGTVPTFIKNYLAEGNLSSGEQSTTLRFKSNLYTLKSVQICEPQHKGLLTASDKPSCMGEVVMIFSSSSALTEKYIFICVPILNRSTAELSPYLESIRQDRLPGKPVGLDQLLPSSKRYISYSTCLRKVTAGKTEAAQAAVLVFTDCLLYPVANFREVLRKMKGINPTPTQAPPLGPLIDGLIAKTEPNLYLLSTEADYKSFLRYSELQSQSSSTQQGNQRIDSTDSYKCVPLNPDETVKNNRLIIDTDKGVPLSQVLAEKKEDQGEAKITPGMVERMIAAVLGTAAGLFILSVIAYIFSLMTSENADTSFPWLVSKTKDLLPMVFVSMVVGVVGFLIGFFTSTT